MKEKDTDVSEDQFRLKKFIKNLADFDNKLNAIVVNRERKKGLKLKTKKESSVFWTKLVCFA